MSKKKSHAVLPAGRKQMLIKARNTKMARSVHAFVRGSTAQFYRWMKDNPAALPAGPAIWICGDCHIGNLGPVADARGKIDIQIRDLDQTVVADPAFDLVRLGLSLETAARNSILPGVATVHILEALTHGYCMALDRPVDDRPGEPEPVRLVRKQAIGRGWRDLANERIGGASPEIPLGKRFWPLTPEERETIDQLFASGPVHDESVAQSGLGPDATVRVVDAAYWKKGCSSLGRLRFAVLLAVTDKHVERFGLVDIKEAVAALAPRSPGITVPRDHAARVVAGAGALAPYLGPRMVAAQMLDRPVVVRELKPQDLKLEIEQFSKRQAVRSARYLGFVLGRAHGLQLDGTQRAQWLHSFDRAGDSGLRMPRWLWDSVVDLAGRHESAYLDHCRTHALG